MCEMYVLILVIYTILCAVHDCHWTHGTYTFQGISCAVDDSSVIDTLVGVSLRDCKQACNEIIACRSVDYIRVYHACQLLKGGSGPMDQLNVKGACAAHRVHRTIGQYCTSDSDCVENHSVCLHGNGAAGGLCFCDKLYRYVAARLECVQVCDHLLDDFDGYVNSGVRSYNSLGSQWITLEECKNICAVNKECMSFEFIGGQCIMARVTVEMLLDTDPTALLLHRDPGWSLYSRKCA